MIAVGGGGGRPGGSPCGVGWADAGRSGLADVVHQDGEGRRQEGRAQQDETGDDDERNLRADALRVTARAGRVFRAVPVDGLGAHAGQ